MFAAIKGSLSRLIQTVEGTYEDSICILLQSIFEADGVYHWSLQCTQLQPMCIRRNLPTIPNYWSIELHLSQNKESRDRISELWLDIGKDPAERQDPY